MEPVEKTTLYLPAEVQRALREESKRSGRPQAEIVREALTGYLAGRPRPLPRSIGIMADGTFDATEVDEIIERELDSDYDRYLRNADAARPQGTTSRSRKSRPAR